MISVSWVRITPKIFITGGLAGKRIFAWWVGGCRASLQWQMDSNIFHRCEWTWNNTGALAGCEPRHLPWISGGLALSLAGLGRNRDQSLLGAEKQLTMLNGEMALKV